ncbi:MAG: SIMPL domain-containing protein [Gammaproteobacteria bacterium]|nr:MAG: SIMPL domain-containing protein [Gammaproteobacteria bacterium]
MATPGSNLPSAVVLALGIAMAGWFTGSGFIKARTTDRAVTVKGISERDARANIAIWPLRVTAADDDLAAAQARLQRSIGEINGFLQRQGLGEGAARAEAFSVSDAHANQYGGDTRGSRFVITQTLIVRSTEPEKVRAAAEKVSELVAAGVVLSSGEQYGGGGPTYVFTGLNELKPAMIADATARAREAAEQFAKDSGSALGGIRRANQGVFEILPRDQAPGMSEGNQIDKTVRVVATVEYRLEH